MFDIIATGSYKNCKMNCISLIVMSLLTSMAMEFIYVKCNNIYTPYVSAYFTKNNVNSW